MRLDVINCYTCSPDGPSEARTLSHGGCAIHVSRPFKKIGVAPAGRLLLGGGEGGVSRTAAIDRAAVADGDVPRGRRRRARPVGNRPGASRIRAPIGEDDGARKVPPRIDILRPVRSRISGGEMLTRKARARGRRRPRQSTRSRILTAIGATFFQRLMSSQRREACACPASPA